MTQFTRLKSCMATTAIKVLFDGRVFVPQAQVDLAPGTELEILVPAPPAGPGSPTTLQRLATIASKFPPNPELPADLAEQHDHYLYGTPKR